MILWRKLILHVTCTCLLFSSVSPFRIVGSRPASKGEFAHQVSIRLADNDEHICGGSILTARHILTAAHCMYYTFGGVRPPITISVIAGQLDLSVTEASFYSNASAIIIHKNYVYGERHEDIAIIELATELPLDSSPLVGAIALRGNGLDAGSCLVSEWSIEEHEAQKSSGILLAAEVDIVESSACQKTYAQTNIELYNNMICAGRQNGEKGACKRDSGSSLICNGLLSGIFSTGVECHLSGYPGIYTDVSKFVGWIEEHVYNVRTSTPPHPTTQTTEPPHPTTQTTEPPHPTTQTTEPPHTTTQTTEPPHPTTQTTEPPHTTTQTTEPPYTTTRPYTTTVRPPTPSPPTKPPGSSLDISWDFLFFGHVRGALTANH